jgi:putative glutamine amidotransferase
MAVRPTIGITAAIEVARWGPWEQEALLAPRAYVGSVQRAGGIAVLVTPDPVSTADPDELLDGLDGVVLSGGADLDPATYGQQPHPATGRTRFERDAFELALTRRAIERDVPLLGICRGAQVLNVARGGTLLQHLPELFASERHCPVPGRFDGGHEVRLAAGSLAARAAGGEDLVTNTHHHQGLDEIGAGLVVSGRALADDLPEAIELDGRRFALGVQWHPEADPRDRVIAALVDAARPVAASRR